MDLSLSYSILSYLRKKFKVILCFTDHHTLPFPRELGDALKRFVDQGVYLPSLSSISSLLDVFPRVSPCSKVLNNPLTIGIIISSPILPLHPIRAR